jgi:hypothetical protein
MRLNLEAAIALPRTNKWTDAFSAAQQDVCEGIVDPATINAEIHPDDFKNFYSQLIHHYILDRVQNSADTYVIGIQGCHEQGKRLATTFIKQFLMRAQRAKWVIFPYL